MAVRIELTLFSVQAWKWDGQTFKRNLDSWNGKPDGPNPNMTHSGGCTVERPCVEDTNGSNPSYELL